MQVNKEIVKESYAVRISLTEDGKILGWAFLVVIFQDRHPEPYGLLENVYVEQEYRSQGLGKKLVNLAIDEAKERGCYKIICTSRHAKPDVQKMYEKFGFKNWGLEFRMDIKESKLKTKD